jgi:lipopolysaccharide biosynthesis glycosyltransferase
MNAAFVTTLDDNFVPGYMVAVSTLIATTVNFNYDIVIFEWGTLSEANKEKIRLLYPRTIFKHIHAADYPGVTYDTEHRTWTYNCGYRFDIFLLREYEKIIFFDCDIVFNVDMTPLILSNINFGAVPRSATRMLQFEGEIGFDAGIMVIGKPFLSSTIRDGLINLLKQEPPVDERVLSRKWVGNEPILNTFFKGKVTWLPKQYNLCTDEVDHSTLKNTTPNLQYIGHKKPWYGENTVDQFDPYIIQALTILNGKSYVDILLKKLSKYFLSKQQSMQLSTCNYDI